MNERLKEIERILLEERGVDLGKQCKDEYIIYSFFNITSDNSTVKRMSKEHYADSSLKDMKKSSKHTLVNKSLRETIDDVVYNLLLRGYELVEY